MEASRKIGVQGRRGELCDAAGAGARGASWGDDGNVIFAGLAGGLSRILPAGGTPAPVTELAKAEINHRWPQVLPGSEAVIFTASNLLKADANIDLLSLKTGRRTTLYSGGFCGRYVPSGHLVYLRQNTLFAVPFDLDRLAVTGAAQPVLDDVASSVLGGGDFDFSRTGTFVYASSKDQFQRSIFWLENSGKLQPLHPDPGSYIRCPRFSSDGKHLAFGTSDGQGHEDVWVQDLDRNTTSRLTNMPGVFSCPVWTPDGQHLIFGSLGERGTGIYWLRADGSGEANS